MEQFLRVATNLALVVRIHSYSVKRHSRVAAAHVADNDPVVLGEPAGAVAQPVVIFDYRLDATLVGQANPHLLELLARVGEKRERLGDVDSQK
jgi:hypothetical protein